MYREACFSQNNVYKWAEHAFAIISPSQKDSPLSGNIDSPIKKKLQL